MVLFFIKERLKYLKIKICFASAQSKQIRNEFKVKTSIEKIISTQIPLNSKKKFLKIFDFASTNNMIYFSQNKKFKIKFGIFTLKNHKLQKN